MGGRDARVTRDGHGDPGHERLRGGEGRLGEAAGLAEHLVDLRVHAERVLHLPQPVRLQCVFVYRQGRR